MREGKRIFNRRPYRIYVQTTDCQVCRRLVPSHRVAFHCKFSRYFGEYYGRHIFHRVGDRSCKRHARLGMGERYRIFNRFGYESCFDSNVARKSCIEIVNGIRTSYVPVIEGVVIAVFIISSGISRFCNLIAVYKTFLCNAVDRHIHRLLPNVCRYGFYRSRILIVVFIATIDRHDDFVCIRVINILLMNPNSQGVAALFAVQHRRILEELMAAITRFKRRIREGARAIFVCAIIYRRIDIVQGYAVDENVLTHIGVFCAEIVVVKSILVCREVPLCTGDIDLIKFTLFTCSRCLPNRNFIRLNKESFIYEGAVCLTNERHVFLHFVHCAHKILLRRELAAFLNRYFLNAIFIPNAIRPTNREGTSPAPYVEELLALMATRQFFNALTVNFDIVVEIHSR